MSDISETSSYLLCLNEEQRAAVMHNGSPLLILAGAGSGKTRVITAKIAYLIGEMRVKPYSILAVTFTKKAAKEMAERAALLEPRSVDSHIRTFHSFGAWFLRRYAKEADVAKNFTVYDDDDMATLVNHAVPTLPRQEAARAAHKISLAKDYCISPDSQELSLIESDPIFKSIYASYEESLHNTGNVDFGDLIMRPVKVLQEYPQIRSQIQRYFRVVMVDEYQDSNVAQFKLLQLISGTNENSGVYVCVVGDDDQSIYRFRGAEVQNILSFKDHFPCTKVIRLEKNYRSTARILNVADNIVRNNEGRLGKTLSAVRGAGGQPVLVFLPTQDDESAFCADLIQKAHAKGCPYHDWAILYRTNAQSLGFETEFLHRKIPYAVVGSLKFYEREEVKDILAFASFIANPRDEIAFQRIVNKPSRSIGEKTQKAIMQARSDAGFIQSCRVYAQGKNTKVSAAISGFADMAEKLSECLDRLEKNGEKLSAFIEKIATLSGLLEYHTVHDEISGAQRASNIQELINSAVLYPCTREGLTDYLDSIELDRTLESSSGEADIDTVTLITLHNTKGLEFNRVIITGLEEGIFPRQNKDGDELEEERRLFYVGITRARDELYVTSCAIRRLYGKTEFMRPSRFLLEAGEGSFKVLGAVPSQFKSGSSCGTLPYASAADDLLARKWRRGERVYHDEYGYGQIISTETHNEELTITVRFESGGLKKFVPAYQAHSLMIVHDD